MKQEYKIKEVFNENAKTIQEKLQEALGHTPIQVFVGALIGLIAGLIF